MYLDPRVVIALLRNHLATHDQPLSFLFGAGTSSSINIAETPKPGEKKGYLPLIPAVDALTKMCGDSASKESEKFKKAWASVIAECEQNKIGPNIENILSRLRFKISAIGEADTTLGLNKSELEALEISIRKTINEKASPNEKIIPENLPHKKFAHWIKQVSRKLPIEVFTTNYDTLIERSFERVRVPVFDGFTGAYQPFFNGDCFENPHLMPPTEWVRVWKVHGSVNWKLESTPEGRRIIRTSDCTDGEMILPSHQKYDESRKQPYQALIDRFCNVLKNDCSLLVTAGYSFNDQHINAIIYDALDNHPLTHVISLQYDDLSVDAQIVKEALGRPNFIVIGRNGGVLHGNWGTWKLQEAVDNRTASFMDVAFDSNGSQDSPEEALRGQVRLGDFNYFCAFLAGMESSSGGVK